MISIKQCRHGRFMFYDTDVYIGRSLELYGEYCEGEPQVWRQILQPGMTAMDVGANIGAFTVYLAKAVGDTGRVFAIEPQRQLYQMLQGNLALNEIHNTFVVHGALGKENGTVAVPPLDYAHEGNFGGLSLGGASDESVPVTTLDQIAPEAMHFIKIDVEGMEGDVIDGATATLKRHKPILYVENDREGRSEALIEKLMLADYKLFWHVTPYFNPKNFFGTVDNIFGATVSINMLCIPASRPVTMPGWREIRSPQETSRTALLSFYFRSF
jgi:FkbM family methyltransferase